MSEMKCPTCGTHMMDLVNTINSLMAPGMTWSGVKCRNFPCPQTFTFSKKEPGSVFGVLESKGWKIKCETTPGTDQGIPGNEDWRHLEEKQMDWPGGH